MLSLYLGRSCYGWLHLLFYRPGTSWWVRGRWIIVIGHRHSSSALILSCLPEHLTKQSKFRVFNNFIYIIQYQYHHGNSFNLIHRRRVRRRSGYSNSLSILSRIKKVSTSFHILSIPPALQSLRAIIPRSSIRHSEV